MAAGVLISAIVSLASSAANIGIAYLMRPRIDQKPIDVGKLDDVRVTGSEYGAFIPRYWGIARMGGNVIWSKGVDHSIVEFPGGGGKGTPQGPTERVHTYRTSLGWLIARSETEKFGRLWADENVMIGSKVGEGGIVSKMFQAEDADYVLPYGDAFVDDFSPWDYRRINPPASGYLIIREYDSGRSRGFTLDCSEVTMPALPPSLDPGESAFPRTRINFYYRVVDNGKSQPQQTIEITGETITHVENLRITDVPDDTYWVLRSRTFNADVDTFEVEVADSRDEARCQYDRIVVEKFWYVPGNQTQANFNGAITGFSDPKVIPDPNGNELAGYYSFEPTADVNGTVNVNRYIEGEALRFYKGTNTQQKDSALIAYLDTRYGTGNGTLYAPAHRPMTMMVFEDLVLRRGRVPNFTVEVQNTRTDVNDILTDFAEDVGLVAGDLDLDATASLVVKGYVEATKASRRQHWENLARYWGFRFGEIDGKITTVVDTFTPVGSIASDSLRAHKEGEDVPVYDFEVTLTPDNEVPREVRFSTMNPYLDYFNETSRASLFADVSSSDILDMSFPIVAEPEEARKRCETMLLKLHSETRQVKFQGMPETMKYAIGDVVTVDINGVSSEVRIERKTADLPLGVVTFEGVILEVYEAGDIDTAVVASEVAAFSSAQLGFVQPPRNAVAVPIITLPIRTKDKGRLGMYIAVSPKGVGQSEAVTLHQQIADETFVVRDIFEVPSVVGVAEDILGNYTGSLTAEDTTNTVDILFYNAASLESVSAAELDANPELNLIRIGGEWVQFRTATVQSLEADSPYRAKWRISNLRRGRFGTSAAISGHEAGEDTVLNTQNLKFYEMNEADVGKVLTFKAVSAGQDIELVGSTSVTFNPVSAYTVSHATPDREFDANNTTIHELADVVATMIDDLKL